MKKILAIAAVFLSTAASADVFDFFEPATGVLKGDASSYTTTAATSADILGLWTGTCDATTFLRGDGSCATAGAGVTSVGLTMPSGFSVSGSPVTGSGSFSVTTTLNGVLKGNGSGFTTSASSDIRALWSGTCNSTTFLRGDGSCVTPSATPGGSSTQIQYNNGGTFAGDADFTWASSTNLLTIAGSVIGSNTIGQFGGSDFRVFGGTNTSGGGTTIRLEGGNITTASTTAGGVSLVGGTPTTVDGRGGPINIQSGAARGTGQTAGTVTIAAGNGTDLGGGNVTVKAGSGSGGGGIATLSAGTGQLSGNGGSLTVNAGDAGETNDGGFGTVRGGDIVSSGTGTGGLLTVRGGDGAFSAAGGGALVVRGGDVSSSGTGGNLTLAGGTSFSGGTSGDVILKTANSTRLTIDETGAWGLGVGAITGTAGQILTSNGAGTAPTWQAIGGAGSTPVAGAFIGTASNCSLSSDLGISSCVRNSTGVYTITTSYDWTHSGDVDGLCVANADKGPSQWATFTVTGNTSITVNTFTVTMSTGALTAADLGNTNPVRFICTDT